MKIIITIIIIKKKVSNIQNLNCIKDNNFSFSGKNNYNLFFDFDCKENFKEKNIKYNYRNMNMNEINISDNNRTIKYSNKKDILFLKLGKAL